MIIPISKAEPKIKTLKDCLRKSCFYYTAAFLSSVGGVVGTALAFNALDAALGPRSITKLSTSIYSIGFVSGVILIQGAGIAMIYTGCKGFCYSTKGIFNYLSRK